MPAKYNLAKKENAMRQQDRVHLRNAFQIRINSINRFLASGSINRDVCIENIRKIVSEAEYEGIKLSNVPDVL